MPFEPQHPTMLHLWGCLCSMVIEGDFVPKGIEQFSCSSQDPNLDAIVLRTIGIGGIGWKEEGGVTRVD